MQLKIFKFQEDGHLDEIRTVIINDEIWFVSSDVAKSLGYSNASYAVQRHCKQKGIVKYDILTSRGIQKVTLINESNVYRLVFKSQLPSAERFEEWVMEKVLPTIRKTGGFGIDRSKHPNFLKRFTDNFHKIPSTHFSVITELFVRLFAALEKEGYSIPDKGITGKDMMPDISVCRGFAKFLRENHSDLWDKHTTYEHTFPGGRTVDACMYPIEVLPLFIRYVHERWIPENAVKYFEGKDPLALDYVQKLLLKKAC